MSTPHTDFLQSSLPVQITSAILAHCPLFSYLFRKKFINYADACLSALLYFVEYDAKFDVSCLQYRTFLISRAI